MMGLILANTGLIDLHLWSVLGMKWTDKVYSDPVQVAFGLQSTPINAVADM